MVVIGVLLLIQRLGRIDPDAEPPLRGSFDDDFEDIAPAAEDDRPGRA